ncbi:hypothetical protein [Anaplasma phagocytophilum]|uniref:hypothetical protein n=1 Tax=Anaplasma phagocytophilum TaxID=948 RepID=UPI00201A3B4F
MKFPSNRAGFASKCCSAVYEVSTECLFFYRRNCASLTFLQLILGVVRGRLFFSDSMEGGGIPFRVVRSSVWCMHCGSAGTYLYPGPIRRNLGQGYECSRGCWDSC